MGLVSVGVTRLTAGLEEAFEKLPVHWMWCPAIGGLAVGVVGYLAPMTLGVGYSNISDLLCGRLAAAGACYLALMKLLSWSVAISSGTSGGTLAPLLTIGGGFGAVIGFEIDSFYPGLGVDPRLASLVGAAALFAGASRATLTSAVLLFETTLQPVGVLPLLGSAAAANLVASAMMTHSMMTEKMARRGVTTPAGYEADSLDQVHVRTVATCPAIAISSSRTIGEVKKWISSGEAGSTHQGYPVVNDMGRLVGVVTRRDLSNPNWRDDQLLHQLLNQIPKFVYEDSTVRQAADHMVNHGIGRLPVVSRDAPPRLMGMLTRSDVLSAFRHRVRQSQPERPSLRLKAPRLFAKRRKVT